VAASSVFSHYFTKVSRLHPSGRRRY
jgi:hypothetical protein